MKQAETSITQTTSMMDRLSGTINKTIETTVKLKSQLSGFGEFSNQKINVDFTGTGSSKRPIMDKVAEVKQGIGNLLSGVKEAAANVNFSNYSQKLGAAGQQAASAAASGGSGLDMKDLGKLELQVGSKGMPVFGKQDVINELKQALKREGLVGAY
jgi:hypothetical protein